MKREQHYILGVLSLWMLLSCSTYKRFYGETEEKLSNPKQVFRLDLSGFDNSIDLADYTDLRMLNLSNLQKGQDFNTVLKSIPQPEKLEVLLLNQNDLERLPESISKFKNLKQLSLQNNPRLDLTQTFDVVKDLPVEFIDLQHNQLKSLPSNIKNLRLLEDLNLSYNTINQEEVYRVLAELKSLKSLWLRHNEFKYLSPKINLFNKLSRLYLEYNHLEDLPNLEHLNKLKVLHLSYNEFEELPESLQTAPLLILLHIDNCKISYIPDSFNLKTSTIRGIVIQNNKLTEAQKQDLKDRFNGFFLLQL